MLGGGGGAYAVAELGPDASALPVQQLVEEVEPLPLQQQSDALGVHSFNLFTTDQVRGSDTVESLLARLQINDPAAAAWLRRDTAARTYLLSVAGRTIHAEADDDRNLVRLSLRWSGDDTAQFKRLVVERSASGGFASRVEVVPYTTSVRVGTGVLRSSLFAAVDDAGIPDAVATQLVDIFGGDIDFHRGLQRGDRFHVVYEMLEADGEPLRAGRVLTAEFTTRKRTHQALWFQPPGKPAGGYFDFDGKSLETAFLASPMEVSRVTSGFKMRFHPIRHAWTQHRGVDYGSPVGTPVRSVGEGKVQFAGWMGGYGNVVQVDHGRGDSTLYAHLSRIDVRPGAAVARGQRLGAVGQTGWATGPHLHFEFRENGVHVDPLEVARRQPPTELAADARPDFNRLAGFMRHQLVAAASLSGRSSAFGE
ncbi:M23 family metallopeptidase [Caenimonas sedimenti]|uniref:M23 family metallopeptidase n=2 Tax=Caenimonas sedimenti TaxID=2596921 RepID=A0A562ZF96_9BURK|nr:M23 family metallopeptidase [Caenimonas sedimenti]